MKTKSIKYPHTVTIQTDNRDRVIGVVIDRGAGRKPEALDLGTASENTFRAVAMRQARVIRKAVQVIAEQTGEGFDAALALITDGDAQASADLDRMERP